MQMIVDQKIISGTEIGIGTVSFRTTLIHIRWSGKLRFPHLFDTIICETSMP
jgi:hypothetical protein